jgi:uncharacterized protein YecE (DUF72 family)
VWGLVSSDLEIGRRAFEGEPFARMLGRAQTLNEHALRQSPQLRGQIQEWVTKVRDVQRRRNEVLHAWWYLHRPTGETIPFRLLGKGETREIRTHATELDQLADDIEEARKEAAPILRAVTLPTYPP